MCELCEKEKHHEKNDYNLKTRDEINFLKDQSIREKVNQV